MKSRQIAMKNNTVDNPLMPVGIQNENSFEYFNSRNLPNTNSNLFDKDKPQIHHMRENSQPHLGIIPNNPQAFNSEQPYRARITRPDSNSKKVIKLDEGLLEVDPSNTEYVSAEKLAEEAAKVEILKEKLNEIDRERKQLANLLGNQQKENSDLRDRINLLENMQRQNQITSRNLSISENPTNKFLQKKTDDILIEKNKLDIINVRKQLIVGNDAYDTRGINDPNNPQNTNCFISCIFALTNFIDFIIPFRCLEKRIISKYDANVCEFFSFFRFILGICLLTLLGFLELLLRHIINEVSIYNRAYLWTYPSWFFYSTFTSLLQYDYLITFYVFIIVVLIITFFRWAIAHHKAISIEVYDPSQIKCSRALFNFWDWSNQNLKNSEKNMMALSLEMKLYLHESKVESKIIGRTCENYCKLITTRIATITLSLLILAIGWFIITLVFYFQDQIYSACVDITFVNRLVFFIPPISYYIVNRLFPFLITYLVDFENWDYSSSVTVHKIFRQYIGCLSNMICVLMLQVDFLSNWTNIFKNRSIIKFLNNYFLLKEDQAGMALFEIGFVTCILDILVTQVYPLIRLFVNKVEYNPLPQAIKLLNLVTILWVSMLLFPFATWINPFLITISLLFEYIYLRYQTFPPRPTYSTPHVSNYLMIKFVISLFVIFAFYTFFFQSSLNHYAFYGLDLGPFPSFIAPINILISLIKSNYATYIIYTILTFSPGLWFLIFILISQVSNQANYAENLRKYIFTKEKEMKMLINIKDRIINKYSQTTSELGLHFI